MVSSAVLEVEQKKKPNEGKINVVYLEASETVSKTKEGLLLQTHGHLQYYFCMRLYFFVSMYVYGYVCSTRHVFYVCILVWDPAVHSPGNSKVAKITPGQCNTCINVTYFEGFTPDLPESVQNVQRERDKKAYKTYKRDPSVMQTS